MNTRGASWTVEVRESHGLIGMTLPELPEESKQTVARAIGESKPSIRRSISRRAAYRTATGDYTGRRTTSPRYGLSCS